MASSIQILRSTTARERPIPGSLLDGQPAVNINPTEPGLFFKATDGTLIKIGPAAITYDGSPPNTPPSGTSGYSIGELWFDASGTPGTLKIFNGTSWEVAGNASSVETIVAGTGLSETRIGNTVTLENTGVRQVSAGSGISVSGSTGSVSIANTGVTELIAGANVTLSGSTGAVTISATGGGPINVRDYGAIGNGVADDTSAIQSAIDENPGRKIYIPKGIYNISSQINVTSNSTVLIGDSGGQDGTLIQLTNSTQNGVVFSGCQFSGLVDISIWSATVPTDGYCVTFQNDCFECFLDRVNCLLAFDGVLINGATETRLSGLSLRYLQGPHGIKFTGTNSSRSYRCIIEDLVADNPYPLSYGAYRAWNSSTGFNLQDIIFHNGRIYQCTRSGTSGATGPSGVPGSGLLTCFTEEITDGTCRWKFVASNLAWITQDSYAYSLVIDKVAAINGSLGYQMLDSAGAGGYPIWAFVHDLECDHNLFAGVRLQGGEGFYAINSWWGSCLAGNGFEVLGTHRGEVSVTTTRIMGNHFHGVLINSGPVDVNLHGNFIGDNSQAQSNTYHGIVTGIGASRFQLTGNRIGDLVGVGGNPQYSGIFVSGGASDQYVISGNSVTGNQTVGISDNGTGTQAIVTDNLGYNPAGVSTASAPTSGGTYRAGHTGETIYLSGGSISAVKLQNSSGPTVFTSTPCALNLGPNETFSITYSSAPTMVVQKH